MNAIKLNLPAGTVVRGEILSDYSEVPERLSPDIVQVQLSSGVGIDVGWSPSFDPSGHFTVVAYRGRWDNQIITPIELTEPSKVAQLVGELAAVHWPTPIKLRTKSAHRSARSR